MDVKSKSDEDNSDDNKIKNSKRHTLFEDCISETKESIDVDGEELFKITPAYKNYRMFIDSFEETERGLHEISNTLWNAGKNDTLELRINSWGGFVKEGQNFYNIIRNKFNGRTTTILDSAGYSMGALTFMVGDTRIAMEESDIMLHDYSTFAFGKGGEVEASVEHHKKHLRNFFKKVIVDHGFLTKKEFKQMLIGKDFWMEVPEMCERGIATHVMIDGKNIPAKKYLKYKNGEISRKKMLKQ